MEDCLEPATPGRSPLILKNFGNDKSDLVSWKFRRGPPTTNLDFGNPVQVDPVTFCLYTGATEALSFEARAPAGETCNGKPCWKQQRPGRSGNKGFAYKDGQRSFDGVAKMRFRPGNEKTWLLFNGRGENLETTSTGLPTPPLALPVTAQIQTAGGECFSASYGGAAMNEGGKFTAR